MECQLGQREGTLASRCEPKPGTIYTTGADSGCNQNVYFSFRPVPGINTE